MDFVENGPEIDDDDDLGVPKEAVYKSHSSDVDNILEHLMENAHARLDAAHKIEADAAHTFTLLEQSLEDQRERKLLKRQGRKRMNIL